jgi:uncharacterized protein YacL
MKWLSDYFEKKLKPKIEAEVRAKSVRKILIDSSALIDGRMLQLYHDNFLDGEITIPSFILREIQQLADSTEYMSSKKGKRGLEVVDKLKKMVAAKGSAVVFPIYEDPMFHSIYKEVDDKLIHYALAIPNSVILTTDGNLGKVAQAFDVNVMNLNTIASGLRSMVVKGDRFSIKLLERSKKAENIGQCIGYLNDGTLVCVEKSSEFLGTVVPIEITNVLNNLPTGRIAFAKLNWGEK